MNESIKKNVHRLIWLISSCFHFIFYVYPIQKNKIVFDNFNGRGYGCDPKYIAEELLNRHLNLDLVWLVNDMDEVMPKEIRKVRMNSWKAAKELSTAKIWVDNVKNSKGVIKKKEQFYIQTWHSSLGLKENEQEASTLPKLYVMQSKLDAKMTDLMYSNNAFRYKKYQTKYWYDGEVIRCGHPRNGILVHTPEDTYTKVRNYFNLDSQTKILLYAPTFRKESRINEYLLSIETVLDAFEKKYGQKFICLLRLHPNVNQEESLVENNSRIVYASKYPDMQELLAVSDVLITDYSGIMFEFMITGKPVFLFMKDLKTYMQEERNLCFSLDQLPFPVSMNETEMNLQISKFSIDKYREDCASFMQSIDMKENGQGAKVIADIILKKIN